MAEAMYRAEELAAKARQMSATIEDAKKTVQEFLNREVK